MRKGMLFRVVSALLFCPLSLQAQGLRDPGTPIPDSRESESGYSTYPLLESNESGELLSSASVSRKFYEIAYELAKPSEVRGPELDQAITFLTAALKLDRNSKGIRPLLIEFAARDSMRDYAALVQEMLVDYVDEFADLEVVRKAVGYLLEQANSREERERLLEQMLGTLGSKNNILGSEIATLLGVLKAEKADKEAATFYLLQAYRSNRYNKAAFAKLVEAAPDQIGPAVYLERLRLALRENPSDIDVAIAFAEYAEQLQLYESSAAAYQYCADLFDYLYPAEVLPARIYLPWAISSYNTQRDQSQCVKIVERIRAQGEFDLRLEAIVAKAEIKLGDNESAARTFQTIEKTTQELLKQQEQAGSSTDAGSVDSNDAKQDLTEQLAWFYCFALPMPDKAVAWANEAFSKKNSPVTATLLAYALVMNGQMEWAKPLIANYERNQITELTSAQIQLAQGQTDLAINTLTAAVARDPGSFAAERAKEILAKRGREYVPLVAPDAVLASLQASIGQTLVPDFIPPEQAISAQLDIRGSSFPYGSEFGGTVVITNNSSEPLVMSDDGLFKGNIRIDAEMSGDLTRKITNLVFTKIQAAFLVEPGRSILIPLRLMTGELRRTLLTFPQATLSIEFMLYIDPVLTSEGTIANRLTQIKPGKVRIERPGVELTTKYLQDQFKSISRDHNDQKIKTAQLFTGLLMEQHAMAGTEPLYKHMSGDWVVPLLRSALTHESGLLRHPGRNEWGVKVYTMAEMLGLPLDHELIKAVAENLNHPKWPVRMMTMYLLAGKQRGVFDKVLDWTVQHDPNPSVREMAAALRKAGSEP
ncbi:tetratricopeptide repeat protein [Planctomycetota bacterium]